ncbi:MAG: prolipoprotein diacylglyceryl transferase [Deltaproteobacteria bacterium]|nr:prolipoprotein diacylglyceryl transferase [Deltaproteobacteria bacterium]
MVVANQLNQLFDSLAHTKISFRGRLYPAYRLCGYTGFFLAVLINCFIIFYLKLSLIVFLALIATTALTFYFLAMGIKIFTGHEYLVYYHHEIAIIFSTSLVLIALEQPLMTYLDIVALGLGIFLFFGRIGCLRVGCCHGRPHAWGITYKQEHADEGFSRHYVGVRLFPTQAIEALWVLGVVIISIVLLFLDMTQPGDIFTWYIMAYGAARFWLEFVRGDVRPFWGGFSEAQWTTIILMFLILGMEWLSKTGFYLWHFIICIVCLLSMIFLTGLRKWLPSKLNLFWFPQDLKDFADKLNETVMWHILHKQPGSQVAVMETKQGIQISADRIVNGEENIFFYSISQKNNPLILKTANRLGKYIQQLKHPDLPFRVLPGRNSVFHILFQGIIFKSKKIGKRSLQ